MIYCKQNTYQYMVSILSLSFKRVSSNCMPTHVRRASWSVQYTAEGDRVAPVYDWGRLEVSNIRQKATEWRKCVTGVVLECPIYDRRRPSGDSVWLGSSWSVQYTIEGDRVSPVCDCKLVIDVVCRMLPLAHNNIGISSTWPKW